MSPEVIGGEADDLTKMGCEKVCECYRAMNLVSWSKDLLIYFYLM